MRYTFIDSITFYHLLCFFSPHLQRLEEEKEEWQLREEKMSGEITMLSQQLEEVIGKADANHGSTKDGTCLREIVALKKKVWQTFYVNF